MIPAVNLASFLVVFAVIVYWSLDAIKNDRMPWDDTYFGKPTISIEPRDRDWDGD